MSSERVAAAVDLAVDFSFSTSAVSDRSAFYMSFFLTADEHYCSSELLCVIICSCLYYLQVVYMHVVVVLSCERYP